MKSFMKCLFILTGILVLSVSPAWSNCSECFCANNVCDCVYPYASGWVYCVPGGGTCYVSGSCGVAHGCFLNGSMVETEGGLTAIEALNVGDRVYGQDASGRIVLCDIEKTYKSLQIGYYLINGNLRVTGSHPFLVKGEWVEASKIKVGDRLHGHGQEMILVETIEIVNKGVRVYNIEVADAHTFFVEGVLVHNKDPDPGLP